MWEDARLSTTASNDRRQLRRVCCRWRRSPTRKHRPRRSARASARRPPRPGRAAFDSYSQLLRYDRLPARWRCGAATWTISGGAIAAAAPPPPRAPLPGGGKATGAKNGASASARSASPTPSTQPTVQTSSRAPTNTNQNQPANTNHQDATHQSRSNNPIKNQPYRETYQILIGCPYVIHCSLFAVVLDQSLVLVECE